MNASISRCNSLLVAVFFLVIAYGVVAIGTAADDAKKNKPSKAAEAVKTKEVKFQSITIKVPESWQSKPNFTKFSKADFEIPAVKGDSEPAELHVSFLFSSSGETTEVINGWIEKFEPTGRKSKVTEGTSPQGKYTIVDVTGTYNKQVGPAAEPTRPLKNARMLATVLAGKDDARYVLILSGPNKTVTAAAKAFRDSFAADAKKEKELKQAEAPK